MVEIQKENTELRLAVLDLEAKQSSLEADVKALKQGLGARNDRRSTTPGSSGYSTLKTPGSTMSRTRQDPFIKDLEQKLSVRLTQ